MLCSEFEAISKFNVKTLKEYIYVSSALHAMFVFIAVLAFKLLLVHIILFL
jgi:hypothetical protein